LLAVLFCPDQIVRACAIAPKDPLRIFVLDFEAGQNMYQMDYFIPGEKKVAAFSFGDDIKMQLLETAGSDKIPEKLDIKTKIDLDALEGILEDEMKNRSISEEIKKIIAVLQMHEGKKIWNLHCVLSGLGILRAHVEDATETILKMEKISMIDIMKHIPKQALMGMSQGQGMGAGVQSGSEENISEEDVAKKQIDKLDNLEK
jgi:hypothetical protein